MTALRLLAGGKLANRSRGLSAKRTVMLCLLRGCEEPPNRGLTGVRDAEPTRVREATGVGHRRTYGAALGRRRRTAGRALRDWSPPLASGSRASAAGTGKEQGALERSKASRQVRATTTIGGSHSARHQLTDIRGNASQRKHPRAKPLAGNSATGASKGTAV